MAFQPKQGFWYHQDMKKFFAVLSLFMVLGTVALSSGEVHAQNKDLCGGTGGNGEIVGMEGATFILKLNEGGQKGGGTLRVELTDHATVETPVGHGSASDLKIGDRVTLVGDNHRDGTFTAEAIVVCSGTAAIGTGASGAQQEAPVAVRNGNAEAYEKANGIVIALTMLLVGSVWLGAVIFLRSKRKKDLVYLLFFTIFFIYLYKVLDYTLFQFQSLLLLQHFVPDLMLNGFKDGTNVNLIPLATLTLEDLKTSLLNILMMLPFGFGLPFITDFRFKKVVAGGLLFSIAIEASQLITGFMADTTFRVADINDLIFNTVGVALGYALFVAFAHGYRRVLPHAQASPNPIVRYIALRPQTKHYYLTSPTYEG
jgi:glycopeptide antibiotics resistance protein